MGVVKYNIKDYIGKSVNNWTVIGFSHLSKSKEPYWECKCSCGVVKKIKRSRALSLKSKGCSKCIGKKLQRNKHSQWKGGNLISSSVYTRIKLNALSRNHKFDISLEYIENLFIKQNKKCVYTKLALTLPETHRDWSNNASLDRIDSSKGYVKDNVQWVTKKINMMKRNLSDKEFIQLCELVALNK